MRGCSELSHFAKHKGPLHRYELWATYPRSRRRGREGKGSLTSHCHTKDVQYDVSLSLSVRLTSKSITLETVLDHGTISYTTSFTLSISFLMIFSFRLPTSSGMSHVRLT